MTKNPTFVRLQSVLYNTDIDSLKRSYVSVVNSVGHAIRAGVITGAEIAYGDCSPVPILSEDIVKTWVEEKGNLAHVPINYVFFGMNKGSAAGHNSLMELVKVRTQALGGNCLLIIMNPDVKMSGDTVCMLVRTKSRQRVGLVEARQLPIEHPKSYDERSGITAWASTATAMTSSDIFWEVGGFDSDSFFLYCDDVDFSWLIREKGYDVIFQPDAVVFHDKRLNIDGSWPTGNAEKYYSAEAALFLTWKWSRPDKTKILLRYFKTASEDHLLKAAEVFEGRRREGSLPIPRDPHNKIGVFRSGGYAPHRF